MKEELLVGQLSSWDSVRGLGYVVIEEEGVFRRFYLHWSRIRVGRELAGINSVVIFGVHPVKEGKLWSAADAIVFAPVPNGSAGLSALNGAAGQS